MLNLASQPQDYLPQLKRKSSLRIFFEYGEEKLSRRIAREIVERRKKAPITTTREFTEICEQVYPPKYKAKGHADRYPATRVFQALRIAVNGELDALASALKFAPDQLSVGGRLAILSFHSLEDRLVKHAFRKRAFIEESDPQPRVTFCRAISNSLNLVASRQMKEKLQRTRGRGLHA
jgi:16S rRNA (cytosine1402-N4)-methyltransferase